MSEQSGVVVVESYSVTSAVKKCRGCKYFDERIYNEHGTFVCPKTLAPCTPGTGCCSKGWKIKLVEAEKEVEVKEDTKVLFTVVNGKPYFVVAEAIFPFEPKNKTESTKDRVSDPVIEERDWNVGEGLDEEEDAEDLP